MLEPYNNVSGIILILIYIVKVYTLASYTPLGAMHSYLTLGNPRYPLGYQTFKPFKSAERPQLLNDLNGATRLVVLAYSKPLATFLEQKRSTKFCQFGCSGKPTWFPKTKLRWELKGNQDQDRSTDRTRSTLQVLFAGQTLRKSSHS